jgi:hypothetical protein
MMKKMKPGTDVVDTISLFIKSHIAKKSFCDSITVVNLHVEKIFKKIYG